MAGDWKCSTCGGINPDKKNACMGCNTPRPGAAAAAGQPGGIPAGTAPAAVQPPAGDWKCPTCGGVNPGKCGACLGCNTPRPGTPAAPAAASIPILATAVVLPSGEWKCPKCGGVNGQKRSICLGCNTPRNIDPFALALDRGGKAALAPFLALPEKEKRLAAAAALAKPGEDPAAASALRAGLEDPDPEIRAAFAPAFVACLPKTRAGLAGLTSALDALSPAPKADLQAALEKDFGSDALDWWKAVAEDFEIRREETTTMVSVPTPDWGGGAKVAAAAAITLLTGSANAGVGAAGQMQLNLNEHIQVPQTCHLCALRPPAQTVRIQNTVSTSLLGAAIAGSSLGDLTLGLDVPLCAACASLGRKEAFRIVTYQSEKGRGSVILETAHPALAQKYADLNQGFTFQVQTEAVVAKKEGWGDMPAAAAPGEASLRVLYIGQFFIGDVKIELSLDGRPIGTGTAKKGIDLTAPCATGRHTLFIKMAYRKKEFVFDLPAAGQYQMTLDYDRMYGNFAGEYKLRYKAPEA